MSPLLESFPDDLPPPRASWLLPLERSLHPQHFLDRHALDYREREHPRVSTCVAVRFRAERDEKYTDAVLGNLSKSGIFIRTIEAIAPDTAIAGGFVVVGEQSYKIKFRGLVCWLTPPQMAYPPGPGIGVRFTRVFEQPLEQLATPAMRPALNLRRLCAAIGAIAD